MAMRKKLSDEQLEEIARFFGILKEPTRLRILLALGEKPRNVTELTELLDLKQANVSKHLALLLSAGILARRKVGLESVYSVQEKSIFQICEIVCGQMQKKASQRAKKLA